MQGKEKQMAIIKSIFAFAHLYVIPRVIFLTLYVDQKSCHNQQQKWEINLFSSKKPKLYIQNQKNTKEETQYLVPKSLQKELQLALIIKMALVANQL